MRLALITVTSRQLCTLKDVAGGFGTTFSIGNSVRAKLLQRIKKEVVRLPPLSQGYIASLAEQQGHEVDVFEIVRSDKRFDEIPRGYDQAWIHSSIVDASAEREVLKEFRAIGTRTVVTGAFASAQPEYFSSSADLIIRGEAENLGNRLFSAHSPASVLQANYADLMQLPFPAWTNFDFSAFRYANLPRPVIPIASSRGCPMPCGYCPYRSNTKFRMRSIEHVLKEIQWQKALTGARSFAFRDPLFNASKDRCVQLATGLEAHQISFSAEIRIDYLNEELLRRLAQAGLKCLQIGVENDYEDALRPFHRPSPQWRHLHSMVELAQKLGVLVVANYILGLPQDNPSSLRRTIDAAKALNTIGVQFTVATPYPNTSLAKEVQQSRYSFRPDSLTGWDPTFDLQELSATQIRSARQRAYVSYHFRYQYILKVCAFMLITWKRSTKQKLLGAQARLRKGLTGWLQLGSTGMVRASRTRSGTPLD